MTGAGAVLVAYGLAGRLVGPLVPALLRHRAKRGKEDPHRYREKLGIPGLTRPDGRVVWLHAVSLGEARATLPVIDRLLARDSALSVLLTTGTVSAATTIAPLLPDRARHQFAPVDTPSAIGRFLDHWRPQAVILVESELWPGWITALARRGIPTALINAQMSERSFRRWRAARPVAARLLRSLAAIAPRGPGEAQKYRALGATRLIDGGNIKAASPPLPIDAEGLAALTGQIGARPVWLFASSHPGEDEITLQAHARLAAEWPDVLTILAPRHVERAAAIADLARDRGWALARRSLDDPVTDRVAVYLADRLGEMGVLIAAAQVVAVGGSFRDGIGGHTPLEPALLGKPVLFGPHMDKPREAADALIAAGGAEAVTGADPLAQAVAQHLRDPDGARATGAKARAAAQAQAQVLDRILADLAPMLPASAP